MPIEECIPLVEDILGKWKDEIGGDFTGYKNHVYRMVHYCFALHDHDTAEREKVIIAGCYHDIGIWTDRTFDYLAPSIERAKEYLIEKNRQELIPEIELMIDVHHKLRKYRDANMPLVEVFRKGDMADFSLGLVKSGLPKACIKSVKGQFPNAGFHKMLVKLAGGWIAHHPLNPVPVLKW